MKRIDIKKEDKWDLTKFYQNEEEYNKDYDLIVDLLSEIEKMKGNILKDENTFYDYLTKSNKMEQTLTKLYVYSYLYHYQDTTEEQGEKYKAKADKINEICVEKTSFIKSEFLEKDYDYVLELINKDSRLEKYKHSMEEFYRYKEHILSEKEERIISCATNAFGTGDEVFSSLDNADAKFGSIIVDGKKIELNHSNFIKYMSDKERDVRKNTFETYYKFYEEHKNSIAQMYLGQIKEDLFLSDMHKFSSPLESSLFNDAISVDVYKNLINTIHNNLNPMYDYMKFRKEFLKLDELHMYDIYTDLTSGEVKKFSYDEAHNIIMEALKPLGEDYLKNLEYLFNSRCVDKYPNDGKRSGAYQWGCFGIDPYVSLNFEGTEDSVSTLAHELGHAMHSYYSNANQDYIYADYPIFLAEIASTVNEVLLNEYMIKNAKDDNEKLLYITSFLDKFRATVYRQTMFAEFEMIMHDKKQSGDEITTKTFSDVYHKLNGLYYGNNVVNDELIKYEWSRIPHFYTPFYVYKYATGFCSAIAIANSILNNEPNAKENYLNFLKSGGSDYPLNILAKCGVNMTTNKPIESAIKMFERKLEQAKKIGGRK